MWTIQCLWREKSVNKYSGPLMMNKYPAVWIFLFADEQKFKLNKFTFYALLYIHLSKLHGIIYHSSQSKHKYLQKGCGRCWVDIIVDNDPKQGTIFHILKEHAFYWIVCFINSMCIIGICTVVRKNAFLIKRFFCWSDISFNKKIN